MKNGLESELVRGTGGSFLECDVSPGPKQRETCPSIVSTNECLSGAVQQYVCMKTGTLSSDPYTELWTCVCVCVCVCVCMCVCVCVCVCVRAMSARSCDRCYGSRGDG